MNNLRNWLKRVNLKQKLRAKQPKIIKDLRHKKVLLLLLFFFLCMYKMSQISKEAYKKYEVEIIDKGRYFWINRRDLEVESDYDNWTQIFDRCELEKQKYTYELMPNTEFQPCRRFVRNDFVEQKIKSCRKA